MHKLIVLALFGTSVWAEKEVYEITGTSEYYGGLYVQTNKDFTYRQLGGPDPQGYFYFLYKRYDQSGWWYLGDGRKQNEITDIYKAWSFEDTDVPRKEGWQSVKSGKWINQGFKVMKRPNVIDNLNYLKANNGSTTSDGGLICLEQDSKKWILLEHGDRRICDKNRDCKSGLDENQDCQPPATTTTSTTSSTTSEKPAVIDNDENNNNDNPSNPDLPVEGGAQTGDDSSRLIFASTV